MFREFNVKFEDVEMLGGTDNLLENTEITKVIVRGDSKMSSLDSTFKNCKELDTIDGELDLNGVSDIDNLLEGTELVKSINLKNVNNENISANNSFPHIEEITIGGELYNKKALQNVIASKEWTFDNISYVDVIGENVFTNSAEIINSDSMVISDTLEQKAKGMEIIGQTYENLVVGNGEHKLTDNFSTTWTESNNSFESLPSVIEMPEIWGNTVQGYANVVSSKLLYDTINSVNWTDGYGCISDNNYNYIKIKTWGTRDDILGSLNNNSFIQLKANTTYSMQSYNYDTKKAISGYTPSVYSPTVRLLEMLNTSNTVKFTTDSTGRVFIFPNNTQSYKQVIRVVEGEVNLSSYDYDEMDLSYIQSVGDLYVDEEGEAILDEEGNEQYKLEIVSSDNINLVNTVEKNAWIPTGTGADHIQIIKLKPNTNYTYYGNQSNNQSIWHSLIYCDENGNEFKTIFNSHSPTSTIYSFKTENKDDIYVKVGWATTPDYICTRHLPMLVVGKNVVVPYVEGTGSNKTNKTTILLPQPLRRITTALGVNKIDKKDRLYWDSSKGKYILEQNIKMYNTGIPKDAGWGYVNINFPSDMPNSHGDYSSYPFILEGFKNVGWNGRKNPQSNYAVSRYGSDGYVLVIPSELTMEEKISLLSNRNVYYWINEPQYIETKILEKPSLETYSPKTYISTNSEVQPSQMSINNKVTKFIPKFLDSNKKYTIKFNCTKKGDKSITVNLGGNVLDVDATLGENIIEITTPELIDNKELVLNGNGNIVTDVFVIADNMSTGELQDGGTYKFIISATNTVDTHDMSVIANKPLGTNERLYWNNSNKRYEIDRNGEIEVPIVEGDIIDLPRLYQKEDTTLVVESGNIKPSKVKVEYLDID